MNPHLNNKVVYGSPNPLIFVYGLCYQSRCFIYPCYDIRIDSRLDDVEIIINHGCFCVPMEGEDEGERFI